MGLKGRPNSKVKSEPAQNILRSNLKKSSLKPLKAWKRRAAIGSLFQPGGDSEEEVELGMCLESREEIRIRQLSSQPFRVTREALNIAARLKAKIDLNEMRPKSLS